MRRSARSTSRPIRPTSSSTTRSRAESSTSRSATVRAGSSAAAAVARAPAGASDSRTGPPQVMKAIGRAPLPRRAKSRGVALVELALSLIFLVPLMLGMLDFGYYFYVASNVEEAARAGVREAALTGGAGVCAGGGFPTIDPRAAAIELPATVTGQLCNATGGDAACYMHQSPLMLGGAANITVTADCLVLAGPPVINPAWRVTVQVDFPLPHPFLFPLLKQSTRVLGWVYYKSSVTSSP